MTAILGYFLLASGIFLTQQLFLWTHLAQLPTLSWRLPLFILINNFIVLFCLVQSVARLQQRWLPAGKPLLKQGITFVFTAIGVSFVFTLIHCLLFFPSIFELVNRVNGNYEASLFYTTVAILVSAGIVALVRIPVLALGGATLPKKVWLRLLHTLLLMPLFHLAELLLLVVAPTLYPIVTQLPVTLKPDRAKEAYKVVGTTSQLHAVYLLNPNMTHRLRQQVLFISGTEGFASAGKILGLEVASSLKQYPAQWVTVILPEVILETSDEAQISAFAQTLMTEVGRSGIGADLLFGTYFKGKNLILYGQKQVGKAQLGVVREKFLLYPLFEKPFLGIDLRGPLLKNPKRIKLPVLNPAQLPLYARPDAFDICYESLYLQRWHFGKPKLVLTNHGAFFNSIPISKSYDLTLKTLGTLFQVPLILVGNRGTTEAVVSQQDQERLNQFFAPPQAARTGKTPVQFRRVTGF